MDFGRLRNRIFSIEDQQDFNAVAFEIFHYQYLANPLYGKFVDSLGKKPERITNLSDIPFLPISFFKSHKVVTGHFTEETIFESSGTTGMIPSRHYVSDFSLYEDSFTRGFERFYGPLGQYTIFALLPSYLERKHSSLVYMVERMRWKSDMDFGGFYLDELENLASELQAATNAGKKVILIGVTYALLEMVARFPMKLSGAIIIETGGMKGRRKEITRMELHEELCKGFGIQSVHSEYGMTELLSQAWSKGNGLYSTPPWMKVLISDMNDPLSLLPEGRTGGINVIDLANVHSCSFIATQDLGKSYGDNSFEVLGRFDSSDIRGCSLMVGA